jgi:hypothetical protein
MPRVVITHAVKDRTHWASKHAERVAAFAPWGTNVVDHFNNDDPSRVAVSVDVHDLAAMAEAIASPEIEAAKHAHGVVDPLSIYIEHR